MNQIATGADIKVQNLTKAYGNKQVLRNLDLTLHPGEFVAVVGRSGCGKSTLLRQIAGLEPPTQGKILIDEQSLIKLNRAARVMFQDSRLLLWKRVLENVGLGLRGNWQPRAIWALEQVGLVERAKDWVSVLSGGQRQRVALARALVSHPRLLLFDEPLGALDALTRVEMQQLIEQLWQEQQFTTLLITHDVEEAVALADRVILLEAGRVALDLRIDLPRPRPRSHADFVTLVDQILNRILQKEQESVAASEQIVYSQH